MKRKHKKAPAQPREPLGTIWRISNTPGTTSKKKSPKQQAVSHFLQSFFSVADLSLLLPTNIIRIRNTIDVNPTRIAAMAPVIRMNLFIAEGW